jgi:hypothetical protein
MPKRLFLTGLVLILVFVISPENISAYRPLGTEDAGVAGKGVGQMEISWDYLKWNGDEEHLFSFF